MNTLRIRSDDHGSGLLEVYENVDGDEGTFALVGSSSTVDLGDAEDALLVAKCIEVMAGFKDLSDLSEQEREKLDDLQAKA